MTYLQRLICQRPFSPGKLHSLNAAVPQKHTFVALRSERFTCTEMELKWHGTSGKMCNTKNGIKPALNLMASW